MMGLKVNHVSKRGHREVVRMYEELHHCMWPVDDDDDDRFYIQNPVNEFQKAFFWNWSSQ